MVKVTASYDRQIIAVFLGNRDR